MTTQIRVEALPRSEPVRVEVGTTRNTAVAVPSDVRGVPGPEGPSAYELAVAGGFVGTLEEWVASLQGPPGSQGPQGPSGGYHRHVQSVPEAMWVINHEIGHQPAVTIVDSAGTEVIGAVSYPSASQVVVEFSSAFAGTAHLT